MGSEANYSYLPERAPSGALCLYKLTNSVNGKEYVQGVEVKAIERFKTLTQHLAIQEMLTSSNSVISKHTGISASTIQRVKSGVININSKFKKEK